MTKQAVLIPIAFVALNAGPVFAADLLLKAPALEAPAPTPGWRGLYVGGNVRYSRAKDDLPVLGCNVRGAPVPGPKFAALDPSGTLGGAQAGINWQSAYWVYGFESDFQLSDEKASIASSGPFTASCHEDSGSCTLTGA